MSSSRKRQGDATKDDEELEEQGKVVRLGSMADALTGSTRDVDNEDVWTVLTDTLSKFDVVKRSRIEDSVTVPVAEGIASEGRGDTTNPQDGQYWPSMFSQLAPGEKMLEPQSTLMMDYVVKSRARFISSSPFDWCKTPSASLESFALQDFILQREEILDPHRMFAVGMYYYQYPEDSSLPKSFSKNWQSIVSQLYLHSSSPLAPTSPDAEKVELLAQRVSSWEVAFRSLYYRWRYGYVQSFYVMLPAQVVLFAHGPTGEPIVAMTKSTPGQRSTLDEMGVQYAAPLLKAVEGGDERMNEGDRSLLLFTTPVDAHGLYDFLLALGPRLTAAVDVPTLLSDDAFAGAKVCRLPISMLLQEVKDSTSSISYLLEISGPILPKNLQRLSASLMTKQKGFELYMTSDERCMGVNAIMENNGDLTPARSRPFSFAAEQKPSDTNSNNNSVGLTLSNENPATTTVPMVPSATKLGRRFLTKAIARDGEIRAVSALRTKVAVQQEDDG